MTRIKHGIGCLLTLSLAVAGCAKSTFNLSSKERQTLTAVQESRLLNAKDAPTPSILPETHYAAGRLFESQGQIARALDQYQKAVAVNHKFAKGYNRIGLLLSKMSRHDEAIDAFERAVALDKSNAKLRNNFGFELMFVQRWSQAEGQFRKAIELEPEFARAQVNLAMALSKQDRFDEALGEFQRVLPEPDAYYNMGLLYRGQGQYGQASNAFQHVLTLNPGFTAARKQLAELGEMVGEDAIGERAMRLAQAPPSPTEPKPSPVVPVTPRRVDEGSSSAQGKPPKSFHIEARQPEPATDQDRPTVHGFTATNRYATETVEANDAPQLSYLDKFPAPATVEDIASNVAMIDDEVNCIRKELEDEDADYVASNDAVVAAIDGVPSPSEARPSFRHDDKPLFTESTWAGRGSTFEDADRDRVDDNVVTTKVMPDLLPPSLRRVALAIAAASDIRSSQLIAVERPYVDGVTGVALARGTWADSAPSTNRSFNRRNDLAAANQALSRVRDKLGTLEREDDQARRAYTDATTGRYEAQLASAQPQSGKKYGKQPTTLRDFAHVQLKGEGPKALSAVLSRDASQRSAPERSRKSILVNDKPTVPSEPRRGRPRTDARGLDDLPAIPPTPINGPWWAQPTSVELEGYEAPPSRDAWARREWLGDFDELDGLIAIIRNEIICEAGIKADLAVPGWPTAEPLDACTLEAEPIMSMLPTPEIWQVCDPLQPDVDMDTITVGDARSRDAGSVR